VKILPREGLLSNQQSHSQEKCTPMPYLFSRFIPVRYESLLAQLFVKAKRIIRVPDNPFCARNPELKKIEGCHHFARLLKMRFPFQSFKKISISN